MTADLQKFYRATNPTKTLAAENPEDRKLYIDFSPVRGGKVIEELKDNITFFSPDEPTCVLFTGHIGCGKSTELLRLKQEDVGISKEKEKFSLAFGIGEITAQTKSDASLREKLNQYLRPQKSRLLEAINKELIEPAIAKLKQHGKKGLVVIVDNLDRIDIRQKSWGRPQQEYLFVDQSEYLTNLHCHLIYTMPLALKFSNEYGSLTQRFPGDPRV